MYVLWNIIQSRSSSGFIYFELFPNISRWWPRDRLSKFRHPIRYLEILSPDFELSVILSWDKKTKEAANNLLASTTYSTKLITAIRDNIYYEILKKERDIQISWDLELLVEISN